MQTVVHMQISLLYVCGDWTHSGPHFLFSLSAPPPVTFLLSSTITIPNQKLWKTKEEEKGGLIVDRVRLILVCSLPCLDLQSFKPTWRVFLAPRHFPRSYSALLGASTRRRPGLLSHTRSLLMVRLPSLLRPRLRSRSALRNRMALRLLAPAPRHPHNPPNPLVHSRSGSGRT